jgi:hypothetical protein
LDEIERERERGVEGREGEGDVDVDRGGERKVEGRGSVLKWRERR